MPTSSDPAAAPIGPDPTGPADHGLCTAYLASTDQPGQRLDAVAFQDLTEAAIEAGQSVDDFCADVSDAAPTASPSATAPGQTGDNPSATAPGKTGETPGAPRRPNRRQPDRDRAGPDRRDPGGDRPGQTGDNPSATGPARPATTRNATAPGKTGETPGATAPGATAPGAGNGQGKPADAGKPGLTAAVRGALPPPEVAALDHRPP